MTWTPDRPTKPGKYWLSIGIDHREKFASDVCREPHHVYLLDIFEEGGGLWLDGVVEVGHCLPASALFNRYVEPADPHVRYQQEEERDELLRKPRLSRTDQARLQELNDALRTESPEERKYLDILRRAAAHRESLRSRIEALPDLVLGSGRVIGGAVDRGAVLALLDEVTR